MSNRGQHNRHQHNRGGSSAVAGSRHPYTAYRLEARTSSGALSALLPYWSNATAKWNMDEHGDLQFEYPYSSRTAQNLTVVFLGDSLTNGVGLGSDVAPQWPARITIPNVTCQNEAVGATKIQDADAKVASVIAVQHTDKVVVWTGTNNIVFGDSYATTTGLYATLISDLAAYDAYFCTIAPRSAFTAGQEVIRGQVNTWLRAQGVKIIDLAGLLTDPNNSAAILPAYTTDGTHLTDAAKTLVATHVQGVLQHSIDSATPASNWSLFNFPAQIWLRDDRGNLMERYHITSRKRVRDDSGHVSIHVTGASLLYQLSREEITNYETGNEIQTVTVSATGGTFTLKFRGYTTGNIAYNASAATIQTALEGLTSIGSGNVAVSGSGPYTIEFQGALAETDVAQLVPNGASLTGSSRKATVATTRTSKTVREVIQNWLTGWQLNSKPITFGYVDPSIGNTTTTIRVENKSILAAIRELQQTYGGVIWVDPSSRRLYWRREQGGRTGQYVKIGKNGQGIEETEDFAGLCTRVIAVGAGDTYETALRVTVNDSTAQSAYGIIPATIVNKSIWDTTTITAWATANLNARKTPRKTYNVGIIDLARLTSADYSFFDLSIGSYIRVIDTELGLSLDTKIVSIERNLDNPLDVKIQVSNPSAGVDGNESAAIVPRERSLEDTIADLFDGLQDQWGDTGFLDALNDALPQSMTTTSSPAAQQVTNIVNSAVADGTIAVPSKGTSIQSVGTANSAGSNSTFAADDHVHKGNHFNATDIAGLPSLAEGNTFHLTGSTKRFGCYVNSLNQILSHI